jgi:uncharacterized membrane protein YoaK (UPF0700 family)
MVTSSAPTQAVPLLLTFNGGFVDTAGFLAIQGLFTAHVTGNFVTIGAALVSGTSGVLTKLLALPVFCAFVLLCRLLGRRWERGAQPVLPRLLALHLILLVAGCLLAIIVLPARTADEWPSLIAGLLLVAAMATQNGLHRTNLASSPPSTLMTGTTTQIMVDLADLLAGSATPAVMTRARSMAVQVGVFALGCGVAAIAFYWIGAWCFAVPPLIAAAALIALHRQSAAPTSHS